MSDREAYKKEAQEYYKFCGDGNEGILTLADFLAKRDAERDSWFKRRADMAEKSLFLARRDADDAITRLGHSFDKMRDRALQAEAKCRVATKVKP